MNRRNQVAGTRLALGAGLVLLFGCGNPESERSPQTAKPAPARPQDSRETGVKNREAAGYDSDIFRNAKSMMEEGRDTFRHDTFGSEAFWGGALRLQEAIEGSDSPGQGAGVSPRTALAVGLKVDQDALPGDLVDKLKAGKVDLDDPLTTIALLKLNAVVGVRGFFDARGKLNSMGITCALCHSKVDDAFSPGIGRRLDGWANRDLDVGKIISLAPNLDPIARMLQADVATVKKVLLSWGPGKYDAELDKDGKAFRPDGKPAATLLPAAFGLAGVNLHTYTGFGSLPYWNAYVANTQMHGSGAYFDPRLKDSERYPVAARTGSWNTRNSPDRITLKLAALQYYQLSLPAPKPPSGSFDMAASERGRKVFEGKGRCATCHVPPLYTEPGYNLHEPAEIGVDDFQSERSPTKAYRTTPLRGLWSHQKGGFYHDGRFATLKDVVDHYDGHLKLGLDDQEKQDLLQFLLSL